MSIFLRRWNRSLYCWEKVIPLDAPAHLCKRVCPSVFPLRLLKNASHAHRIALPLIYLRSWNRIEGWKPLLAVHCHRLDHNPGSWTTTPGLGPLFWVLDNHRESGRFYFRPFIYSWSKIHFMTEIAQLSSQTFAFNGGVTILFFYSFFSFFFPWFLFLASLFFAWSS